MTLVITILNMILTVLKAQDITSSQVHLAVILAVTIVVGILEVIGTQVAVGTQVQLIGIVIGKIELNIKA